MIYTDKHPGKSAWLFWLIILAVFPDIDYGFLWLLEIRPDIRVTHSILFCSVLPTFTAVYLTLLPESENKQRWRLPAFGAAYSHLILDLLTGVSPLPLLWPFTGELFNLPFGILPGAGRIAFANWYFYRNLNYRTGHSFTGVLTYPDEMCGKKRLLFVLHVLIFIPFFVRGITLER